MVGCSGRWITRAALVPARLEYMAIDNPIRTSTPSRTSWSAIVAMTATSFVLVVAEFLPPSLLPSMAASLGISEGQAGQAVTATALVGFVTAPTIGMLFPSLDRRTLLGALAVAAAASNILVAVAPNLVVLLVARLLLGAAIGGFWAMSIAVAARLAAPHHLGRALMLVNTGTTAATVVGVPLGLYLGSLTSWRTVFAGVAVLTLVVAAMVLWVLPPVAPAAATGFGALRETLAIRGTRVALTGHVLVVLGHFVAFTYVRAALGLVPDLDAGGVAVVLVVFGLGGFLGNLLIGLLVDKHLRSMRILVPALIATGIAGLAAFPGQTWLVVIAVGVWGFAFGAWLIVAATWMGHNAPEQMEAGGGLLVAGFQLAITLGAGLGGLLVDGGGIQLALTIAAGTSLVGGLLFGLVEGRTDSSLVGAR
ncbi:MFS transporter [Rhodococcus sp. H29-C3]|uniref:MFS transporter n=1 Tax=Rhodococcus sp. H29-C3 TaxID=3046307 RepID=UPI0024BA073D|nr:MFS transporter [Rhodococcus sp. H29-C3]MDJ0362521.1 MFS transporter [Rhodococcus sp. H29-C3]